MCSDVVDKKVYNMCCGKNRFLGSFIEDKSPP